jgi:uncharacterized integral membrane protein (TIGR00697 family)
MMDNFIRQSIYWLQHSVSAEILTIILFLVSAVMILSLLRFYGAFGLYVYNALALTIANIQVLRFTYYESFSEPVALGTVLITTTFFVNDILSEHYGPAVAKRCVTLGFWAQCIVIIWMVLALGHPLIPLENATNAVKEAHLNYEAMMQLFTPSLRILFASLIAYFVSQWLDIVVFNQLRKATKSRFLWLRQNSAMLIAGFLDIVLFSVLAWSLLNEQHISATELWVTYILSAQIIRMILNVAFTPLMYLSYTCVRHSPKISF